MHTYIHTVVHACIHTYMHAIQYLYTYTHTYTTCTQANITSIQTRITCIPLNTPHCIHTRKHAYIRTFTYTHTCTASHYIFAYSSYITHAALHHTQPTYMHWMHARIANIRTCIHQNMPHYVNACTHYNNTYITRTQERILTVITYLHYIQMLHPTHASRTLHTYMNNIAPRHATPQRITLHMCMNACMHRIFAYMHTCITLHTLHLHGCIHT